MMRPLRYDWVAVKRPGAQTVYVVMFDNMSLNVWRLKGYMARWRWLVIGYDNPQRYPMLAHTGTERTLHEGKLAAELALGDATPQTDLGFTKGTVEDESDAPF